MRKIITTPDRDGYRKDEGWGRFYYHGQEGPFLSVTNAIKLGMGSPYLPMWYAKVVAEEVANDPTYVDEMRESLDDTDFVKYLKALPVEARDAAGELGTLVHDVCEEIMLGGSALIDLPAEAARRVKQFVAFRDEVAPSIVAVEGIVFSRRYGYAGAFDLVADIDYGDIQGRYIIDIKTGKGVYGSAALQQTAYQRAEFIAVGQEEVPMLDVDGAMILHLQKTQWRLLPVDTSAGSWSAFRSALSMAQWIIESEDEAIGSPLAKGKA